MASPLRLTVLCRLDGTGLRSAAPIDPDGMRAARIDGMSLRVDGLSRDSSPDWLDHDFVIAAIGRNKLKD
jgi:hypothetical protein